MSPAACGNGHLPARKLFHAPVVDKVVHIGATQRRRDGLVDVGKTDAQCLRLFLIDIQLELRRIFQSVWTHAHQQVWVLFTIASS